MFTEVCRGSFYSWRWTRKGSCHHRFRPQPADALAKSPSPKSINIIIYIYTVYIPTYPNLNEVEYSSPKHKLAKVCRDDSQSLQGIQDKFYVYSMFRLHWAWRGCLLKAMEIVKQSLGISGAFVAQVNSDLMQAACVDAHLKGQTSPWTPSASVPMT